MKGHKGLAGILVFVVIILSSFLLSDAFAAENMAYVDLELVLAGYTKTKDYESQLNEAMKSKQDDIDKKVAEIKEMQDKLPLLSEKEKANKQDQIDKKTTDLQEFQRSAEMELRKIRDERMKEILQDVQDVVDAAAKDKGYSLILDKRTILYGSDNLDITNDMLKKLNDNYKKK